MGRRRAPGSSRPGFRPRARRPTAPSTLDEPATTRPPAETLDVVLDRLVVRAATAAGSSSRSSRRSVTAAAAPRSSCPDDGRSPRALLDGARLRACGFAVREPRAEPVLVQQPARRLRDLPGLRPLIDLDLDLVVPDPRGRSPSGAIKPWTHEGDGVGARRAAQVLPRAAHPDRRALGASSRDAQRALWSTATGAGDYPGIRGWFKLARGPHLQDARARLPRRATAATALCPACDGARLKPEALDFRVGGRTIAEVDRADRSARRARFFAELALAAGADRRVAALVLDEIRSRLRYLVEVGLEYLTLDRQSRTLSGGELERVDLTTAIGSSLVNTLYVLDEPSVGLHPRDNERLVAHPASPARQGQHGGRGRARPGDHPRRRPRHRPRARRRASAAARSCSPAAPPSSAVRRGSLTGRLPRRPAAHPDAAQAPAAAPRRSRSRIRGARANNLQDSTSTSRSARFVVRHRRVGLGQVDAGRGGPLPRPAEAPAASRSAIARRCTRHRGRRADRRGRSSSTSRRSARRRAATPPPTSGLRRRSARCFATHRARARCAATRRHLLVQRRRRALRGVRRARASRRSRCSSSPTSTCTCAECDGTRFQRRGARGRAAAGARSATCST